jgi:hypothetical protein
MLEITPVTLPPNFFDLLPPPAPQPKTLCGKPLPPWSEILANAGIPESPGFKETMALIKAKYPRSKGRP